MHDALLADLKRLADSEKAAFFPRFFKAGPGQYAEGDVFLGVTVPNVRSVAREHRHMPLSEAEKLLMSPLHECRLAALFVLTDQFKRGHAAKREEIARFYLAHLDRVNNWDLVDGSADKILGAWLDETGQASMLDRLAASGHLWTQRVAIIATFHFIRKGELAHTFRIAETLMDHPHDLIHKAVGWMLREAGKRDEDALVTFLRAHHAVMPRTALRYAIEKFPEHRRRKMLRGEY